MPRALRKKPALLWRDPATLSGQNEELEIVRILGGIELQEGWERSEAISFLKLTLERA